MEAWHIVALVLLIVIFLIIGAIIIYVLYRSRRYSKRDASKDIVYFFKPDGAVDQLDLNTIERNPQAIGASISQRCGIEANQMELIRSDERCGAPLVVERDIFFSPENLDEYAFSTAKAPLAVRKLHPESTRMRMIAVSGEPIDELDILPTPQAFPSDGLITTQTLIVLRCVNYAPCRLEDGAIVSSAVKRQMVREGRVIDRSYFHTLEAAVEAKMPAVDLGNGAAGHINYATGQVHIVYNGATIAIWQRVCASALRFTYDSSSLSWTDYTEPFRLPPGRHCLQVQAVAPSSTLKRTFSRVYTVQPQFINPDV